MENSAIIVNSRVPSPLIEIGIREMNELITITNRMNSYVAVA
ncbi:MAG: hypothetical protein ABFD07_13350 [Methanobacterium sp.]